MSDSFQPQTPFEGFVYAKLESMTERLNSLPCSEQNKRLGKCETDISNIKGKATAIGAIAGFVSAWFAKYIMGK